ncbi:hypothetical protein [uncultured Friedmanniella sp.]|uniref:hypothetical protein n=1 Tax=uncultured Friedmanniella sp. TaxID=335381 RepID=UPI0035CBD089
MKVTLLGPQRRASGARSAVAELVPQGPVAAVNAGWLEREADTRELDEVLGGRLLNLELHRRWQSLREEDAAFDESQQWLSDSLSELRTAYRLRLLSSLTAVAAVRRQVRDESLRTAAHEDEVAALRTLDEWNLRCGQQLREEAAERVRAGGTEAVDRHRAEVARMLDDSAGLVVTGGHVAILLHLLNLFGVADRLRTGMINTGMINTGMINTSMINTSMINTGMIDFPVIAWSAGAMALSERVVLFHDHPPYGDRPAEVYAAGVGAYSGLVVLPHARRRLRLDDHDHVGLLARRLAPRRAVILNDGARLDLGADGTLPPSAPRLTLAGGVAAEADVVDEAVA